MKALTPFYTAVILAAWPLSCLSFPIFVSGLASAETRRSSRLAPNQVKMYKKAQEAFEAKRFDDAADLLTQILQKQPDSTASKVLLARSLYQLKRFSEAFKLFQQQDLNVLDPEPSYEFGQSALKINEFAVALKAFRNVPNGHPLFDLAGYYGGFCALKGGEYQLALDLLEQAVVLPSKLVRSQKLYQKEAERLLMQRQREDVQTTQTPLPVPPPSPPPTAPVSPPQASVEESKTDRTYRYLKAIKSVKATTLYTSQEQVLGNKAVLDRQVKEGEFRVSAGLDRTVSHSRSPHYLIQAELALKALEGAKGRIGIMPEAPYEQELNLLNKSPSRSLLFAEVRAAVEWPIADRNSLGLELGGYLHRANDPGGLMAASPYVNVFLAQRNQAVDTYISLSSHARTLDGEMQSIQSRQLARVNFLTPVRIMLGVQGELQEFAYSVDQVDGPDWLGQIRAEIGYQQETELQFFVGAMFETGQGYRLHNLGDSKVLGFDPSNFGGYVRARAELSSWLSLGAFYQSYERTYSALQPATLANQQVLKTQYPASIQTMSGFLEFDYSF